MGYFQSSSDENGLAIALDHTGAIYVAGWTRSPDFPMVNPLQPDTGGPQNGFVSKFAPDGQTLLYSTFIGGSGDDTIRGIVVDSEGNALITGATKSRDFPTMHALQPSFGCGARDGFVAKLTASGDAFVSSTYLGGNEDDEGNDIALAPDPENSLVYGLPVAMERKTR